MAHSLWFILTGLFLALPAQACPTKNYLFRLGEGEPAACRNLGWEGDFSLAACGESGILKDNQGRQFFLRANGNAWYYHSDRMNGEIRLVEVLWMRPDLGEFSYASSMQDKNGDFHRQDDCKGTMQPR
ncbi:MAG TPA: hypothetical protein VIH99_08470 [Bdellovibrionota bacterium]|jgi:hypothetical protein